VQTNRTGSRAVNDKKPLTGNEKHLLETCRDFEAIFLGELLKSMRKTVPQDGILGRSFGEDVFQSMLDEEYAKSMASTHSTGLAEILFRQLQPALNQKA